MALSAQKGYIVPRENSLLKIYLFQTGS